MRGGRSALRFAATRPAADGEIALQGQIAFGTGAQAVGERVRGRPGAGIRTGVEGDCRQSPNSGEAAKIYTKLVAVRASGSRGEKWYVSEIREYLINRR